MIDSDKRDNFVIMMTVKKIDKMKLFAEKKERILIIALDRGGESFFFRSTSEGVSSFIASEVSSTPNLNKITALGLLFRSSGEKGYRFLEMQAILQSLEMIYQYVPSGHMKVFRFYDGTELLRNEPFSRISTALAEYTSNFVRINGAYMVNIGGIDPERTSREQVVLYSGKRLSVGRQYRKTLARLICNLQKEKNDFLND